MTPTASGPPDTKDVLLTTARLTLRLLTVNDADALYQVFADQYARRFYPQMSERGFTVRWIQKNLERYETESVGLWALCLRTSRELVGDCGLTWQRVEATRELEVGYHIRADQRVQGLATEAVHACVAYGFEKLHPTRIVSIVHPDNTASRAVAEKVHRHSGTFDRDGEQYSLFYTTLEDHVAVSSG